MKKTLAGTNPDGTPHYSLVAERGEHAVLTGPIAAIVTTKDGTVYDVSDVAVGVPDKDLAEVLHGIHQHYERYGHPEFPDGFTAPSFADTETAASEAIKARKSAEKTGA